MPIHEQPSLPIALGIRDLGKRAGSRLMAIVREVVRDSGKQESVASDLGVSPELLSQALNSQRVFHAEWLPALLRVDHERKILGYLAWQAMCRVTPVDPFTDADFRRATEAALVSAGPLGDVLRSKIFEGAQAQAEAREMEEDGSP